MRGGISLDWIRPLQQDGNLGEGISGCYRGHFEHWNQEIQPGLVPRLVHKKHRASRERRGWRVATPAESRSGFEVPMSGTTGLSGVSLETENLILMVAPIENVAAERKRLAEQTKALADGVGRAYVQNASGSEAMFEATAKRPIRFEE